MKCCRVVATDFLHPGCAEYPFGIKVAQALFNEGFQPIARRVTVVRGKDFARAKRTLG